MDILKAGDTVKLKTGGPDMVVEQSMVTYNGGTYYRCQWFDSAGKLNRDSFPHDSLIVINRGK